MWLAPRYWTSDERKWVFAVRTKHKDKTCICHVIRVSSLGIRGGKSPQGF